MKSIVIIANFTGTGDVMNSRFYYLANLLTEKYQVEVITSDFAHGKKTFKAPWEDKYKFKVTFIHEPGYPNNVCPQRLYSHWIWGQNVAKYLKSIITPDYIYCAVPSLTASLKAGRYAKKIGAQFIIDIQDLWPEAFGMVMGTSRIKKWTLLPLKIYADTIYKMADKVIGVSNTYRDRGLSVNKKAQGLTVYLGNDGTTFDSARDMNIQPRSDKELKLAYIGTLGYSYDIPCIIDAISKVIECKSVDMSLKFVVMGNGPLKGKFEEYAAMRKIDAEFTGALPYSQMVGKLCACDIVVNPIVKGAAQSITNKIGDFALSGLPVINTQECAEYRTQVEQRGLGINCEVGNSDEVANAIKKLALDPALREKMGRANRCYGEECFDRRNTYNNIVAFIEQPIQKG